MVGDARDTFSSRLHEEPARVQLEYYRKSNLADRMSYIWEPLLSLNRSQAIDLAEVGIFDTSTAVNNINTLNKLEDRVDTEEFEVDETFEGPYFYIEDYVSRTFGEEVGGTLHTGRSRNDLFAAAYRIAVRDGLLAVAVALLDLREVLLERAAETTDVVFPAFTHSQPDQPITFSHYLLAILVTNLSRLSQNFLLWGMFEIGFVKLSEGMSGVSGIMLQKKNPYVIEEVRSMANETIGAANESLTALKATPYGDVSENMYGRYHSFEPSTIASRSSDSSQPSSPMSNCTRIGCTTMRLRVSVR